MKCSARLTCHRMRYHGGITPGDDEILTRNQFLEVYQSADTVEINLLSILPISMTYTINTNTVAINILQDI